MLWKCKRAVLTRCDPPTGAEGVSLITMLASAHRIVLNHWALRVCPAGTRARVTALFIDACLVAWAFTVYNTLRPAVWWGSNVAWQAGACCNPRHVLALSKPPTWVSRTRVCHYRLNWFWRWKYHMKTSMVKTKNDQLKRGWECVVWGCIWKGAIWLFGTMMFSVVFRDLNFNI